MFYYNNVLIKFIKLINIVCSRFYVLEKFMMHSAPYIARLCRLIRSPWRWVNLSSREINTLSKYTSLRKLRCYSEIKIARCSEALRDANITFYMIWNKYFWVSAVKTWHKNRILGRSGICLSRYINAVWQVCGMGE